MVTYGPWIQDPNFEQTTTYTEAATFDNRYLGDDGGGGYTDNGWSGTPRQVLLADLENALIVAKGNHGDASMPIDHGVEYGYGQDRTVVPVSYQSNWGASYMRAKWRVAPSPDGYAYSPASEGLLDPAATALQFEGSDPGPTYLSSAASIEGVSLDALTEVSTRVSDSTATDGVVDEDLSSGTWETTVVVQADGALTENVVHTLSGFAATTSPNALVTTLAADVDLTTLLAGAGWSGVVWTETPAFVIPNHMPPDGEAVDSGIMKYGWVLLRPRVTYLVKPPRYRWVYGDDVTYRRVYPRDDRRNWPIPKAYSRGNRRGGGYL